MGSRAVYRPGEWGGGRGTGGGGGELLPGFIFYECDHVFFCLVKRGRSGARMSRQKGSSRVLLGFQFGDTGNSFIRRPDASNVHGGLSLSLGSAQRLAFYGKNSEFRERLGLESPRKSCPKSINQHFSKRGSPPPHFSPSPSLKDLKNHPGSHAGSRVGTCYRLKPPRRKE